MYLCLENINIKKKPQTSTISILYVVIIIIMTLMDRGGSLHWMKNVAK
jgi:hypothetical protein